jgi:FAD/FMN-containing dehydrogenase
MFFLGWPWRRAAGVLGAWQTWAPSVPDELWSTAHALAAPGAATPHVKVNGLFIGAVDELERHLDRLYARVGAAPSSSVVQASTYQHAMMVMAGCSRRSVAACHLPWQVPGGALQRETYAGKSDIVTRPLPSAGIGTVLREVERRQGTREPGGGGVLLDALGGAVNRVPAGQTAFVHRDGLFTIQYLASWRPRDPAAVARRNLTWLRGFRGAMRPYVSGQAYQNYPDEDLTDWRRAYYGANYPRLVRVKARYDPDQLFRPPQGIPPR